MHLHVPAPDVEKFWRPGFGAIGRFGEIAPDVAAVPAAHGTLSDRAIRIRQFRRHQSYAAARRPTDGNAQHVRRILAQIVNHIAIRERMDRDRAMNLKFPDRRRRAGKPFQFAARTVNHLRRLSLLLDNRLTFLSM